MTALLEFEAVPLRPGMMGGGVLRGVKILGMQSRNGREYPAATLRAAAGLYEGAAVNVDHAPAGHRGSRRYRDRIGRLRSVHLTGEGLRADFHYNPKHALAEQLEWDAQHSPENVGFSHNIDARVSRSPSGKDVVEEITRVLSIDLVADPATTQGLFEGDDTTTTPEPLAESAESALTFAQRLRGESTPGRAARDRASFIERLTGRRPAAVPVPIPVPISDSRTFAEEITKRW